MALKIILADDHVVVRDGLRLILEADRGMTVVGEVADGRAAVRMVKKLLPDVVLMDIAMPELNGIDATMQIREQCPSTQIVVLSMHGTAEHIHRALQAGARGYLLKESAGKEVVTAIRAVHGGRRYLSERIADTVVDDFLGQPAALPEKNPLERLSSREREVLQLVVEGKSSADIAASIYLSPKTVATYRSRIKKKLNLHDLASLVRFAIEHGLTPSE
ncbi:MAG: response regulator transcription factor [Spirochaetia bacterium]